ncbi:MAG: 5'/3'-nucleotidase SurE [Pseudomonadota bacterium]
MRILITNDDGISAPGLRIAEAIGHELAGQDGEVWVVAPAFEQSGVSHCVSYIRPMRLEQLEERRFAVEGSPADCVLAAVGSVLKDAPPDLVISGVNRGHNVADDTLYSGTIGGAMEGALHGIRSIALSQYYRPDGAAGLAAFDSAAKHGAPLIRKLLDASAWREDDYHLFYSVNFPPVPASEVKGVQATFQGARRGPTFGVKPLTSPNGRNFLWLSHGTGNAETAEGSDARTCMSGYVTCTPLSADLTVHDMVKPLSEILN